MTMLTQQPPEHPQPHRFTRDEYHQMADLGFFAGHRVELIEGEIIEMAPMKDLHAVTSGIVGGRLGEAFAGCWVRNQMPLSFLTDSEPEPDFAVVPGQPRDYKGKGPPAAALLVVEISDSTLRFDRGIKASIYARAGIRDYWIVNLQNECVEVLRDPAEDATAPLGWRYQSVVTLRAPATVSPLAKPEAQIAVADLLP